MQRLEDAVENLSRVQRLLAESEALAATRADQARALTAQLKASVDTSDRHRRVIESLEQERATLMQGVGAVQQNDQQRAEACEVKLRIDYITQWSIVRLRVFRG